MKTIHCKLCRLCVSQKLIMIMHNYVINELYINSSATWIILLLYYSEIALRISLCLQKAAVQTDAFRRKVSICQSNVAL